MKKLSMILICCQLLFSACSDKGSRGSIVTTNEAGITGGQKVIVDSKLSRMVVLVDAAKISSVGFIRNGREVFPVERILCTGTFITENIVLTAAHCIKEAPFKMRIVYSENSSDKSARHSGVAEVLIHESYVKGAATSTNDIALIKIQGKRPSDYSVSTITTMPATTENFSLLSIGYGLTDNKLDDGGILRRVMTTGISYDPSSPTFTIDQSVGTGVCQGDSGGPGFVLKDGKFSVLGVASSVYSLEKEDKTYACRHFGVYANAFYHASWLVKAIEQLNGTANANNAK